MKLYIVCLLVALASVTAMPAPEPQQSGNISASPIGPLTTLYSLAMSMPNAFLSTVENAMQPIPFANMFPAALHSGIEVGKNFAEGMDHTISGLTGGRGRNPFAALMNPFSMFGGRPNNNAGPVGGQFGGAQSNPMNGLGNLMNSMNPLNILSGGGAAQNGQAGGQVNPLSSLGNTLNNLNPLNMLQGAASQLSAQQNQNGNNPLGSLGNALNNLNPLNILSGGGAAQNGQAGGQVNPLSSLGNTLNNLNPLNVLQGATSQLSGQQNPNGNNPLSSLSNGAAQAMNQLSPAAIAQYLQQISQGPNAASNAASNLPNPNGANPMPTANFATAPASAQNEGIQTP